MWKAPLGTGLKEKHQIQEGKNVICTLFILSALWGNFNSIYINCEGKGKRNNFRFVSFRSFKKENVEVWLRLGVIQGVESRYVVFIYVNSKSLVKNNLGFKTVKILQQM